MLGRVHRFAVSLDFAVAMTSCEIGSPSNALSSIWSIVLPEIARDVNLSLIAKNPGLNRSILLSITERCAKEESGENNLF
jgi:hypothetical protein